VSKKDMLFNGQNSAIAFIMLNRHWRIKHSRSFSAGVLNIKLRFFLKRKSAELNRVAYRPFFLASLANLNLLV
jgi:hypothetical protein